MLEKPFGSRFELKWSPGLDRGGLITGLLAIALGALSLGSLGSETHPPGVVSPGDQSSAIDHRGQIPCTRFRGQPLKPCAAVVQRADRHITAVHVVHPDGAVRELVFRDGDFQGCRKDRRGCSGLRMVKIREENLFLLRVGTERYEVPGALISRG